MTAWVVWEKDVINGSGRWRKRKVGTIKWREWEKKSEKSQGGTPAGRGEKNECDAQTERISSLYLSLPPCLPFLYRSSILQLSTLSISSPLLSSFIRLSLRFPLTLSYQISSLRSSCFFCYLITSPPSPVFSSHLLSYHIFSYLLLSHLRPRKIHL